MDYLLDTHAIIWFITDDKKLPSKCKEIIENTENNCFVSLSSYWEIAIKHSLDKLTLNTDLRKVFTIIQESLITKLPINEEHILTSSKQEFHHRDPFDRLIIAQAITENLTILSIDSQFSKYPVKVMW